MEKCASEERPENNGGLCALARRIARSGLGHGAATSSTKERFRRLIFKGLQLGAALTLSSSFCLQALWALGICGGRDLRDQDRQEEGESPARQRHRRQRRCREAEGETPERLQTSLQTGRCLRWRR